MSRIEEAMRQAGRKTPAVPSGNTDGSLEAFPVTSTVSDSVPVVERQAPATARPSQSTPAPFRRRLPELQSD